MKKNTNKQVDLLNKLINMIAERVVYKILREEQILATVVCKVATYDSISDSATLYIAPDYTTASSVSYKNKTGSALSLNQKVYLIYRWGDVDQGWIAYK